MTVDWRLDHPGGHVTFVQTDGTKHRTTMDALAALLVAARRIVEERDTGKPDPAAWVELRNAVREMP